VDIVLVFPGQGSQKPGMAKDLYDAFPEARATIDSAAQALPRALCPLPDLMFNGPADSLTQTNVAQPALLTHGAALWAVLKARLATYVRAAAGHSLGEFTAYHAAGALPLTDAVKLVRARGDLMFKSGSERPGTMAAILGVLTRPIDEICGEASAAGTVVAANYNTDEQVVISGDPPAVEKAMELAKAAGARRAMPLNVSGAFHSPLMEPSAPGLRSALGAATWRDPAFPVYSNVDAVPNRNAASAKDLLARQLTSPVRWVDVVRKLAADFPDALFVELGPGNVAVGTIKRNVTGAKTFACGTTEQVNELLTMVAA
jgi:[acyl-carrier-protein] S-malonyltransferase